MKTKTFCFLILALISATNSVCYSQSLAEKLKAITNSWRTRIQEADLFTND